MNAIIFSRGNNLKPNTEKIKVINNKSLKDFSIELEKIEEKLSQSNNKRRTSKDESINSFEEVMEKEKSMKDDTNIKDLEEKDKDIDKINLNENLLDLLINGMMRKDDPINFDKPISFDGVEFDQFKIIPTNLDEEIDFGELVVEDVLGDNFIVDNKVENKISNNTFTGKFEDVLLDSNQKANKNKIIRLMKESIVSDNEELPLENSEINLQSVEKFTQSDSFREPDENLQDKAIKLDNTLENKVVKKEEKELKSESDIFPDLEKSNISFLKDSFNDLDVDSPINTKEVIEQVVDKFKFDLSNSKNQITINLKPEVLGEMTMSIEVIKDSIVAKIMVDNDRTKEIIEGNLIQLKEGIKDTGLEIKTFEVFVGNNSDLDKHSSNGFNFHQNNRKVRLMPQENKLVSNYEDSIQEISLNKNDPFMESKLNLLA